MKLKKIKPLLGTKAKCEIYNVDAAIEDCDLYQGAVKSIPDNILNKKIVYVMATGYNKYNIFVKIKGLWLWQLHKH